MSWDRNDEYSTLLHLMLSGKKPLHGPILTWPKFMSPYARTGTVVMFLRWQHYVNPCHTQSWKWPPCGLPGPQTSVRWKRLTHCQGGSQGATQVLTTQYPRTVMVIMRAGQKAFRECIQQGTKLLPLIECDLSTIWPSGTNFAERWIKNTKCHKINLRCTTC